MSLWWNNVAMLMRKRVYLPGRLTSLPFEARCWVLVPLSEVDVGRSASAEFPTGLGYACIEKLNLPFDVGAVYDTFPTY
jgi:hypothetical protein